MAGIGVREVNNGPIEDSHGQQQTAGKRVIADPADDREERRRLPRMYQLWFATSAWLQLRLFDCVCV